VSQLKQEEEGVGALTTSQRPRAIVLTATKELVMQCRQVGKQIAHHAKIKVEGLGLGRSLNDERRSIMDGVDILISSHAKMQTQLENNSVYLSNLKWLVVDETDTIFEIGKLEKVIREFLERTKNMANPPKILFSGTTSPPDLKQLLKKELKDYTEIIDKNTHMNLENIKHEFLQCQELDKHQTLLDVLFQRRQVKTLILCSTIKSLH
jgi:superfamily II DNA/RNA helicase